MHSTIVARCVGGFLRDRSGHRWRGVFVSKENVRVTRALPLGGVSSYPDVLSTRAAGGGDIQLTARGPGGTSGTTRAPRRAGIAQSQGRVHGPFHAWLTMACAPLSRAGSASSHTPGHCQPGSSQRSVPCEASKAQHDGYPTTAVWSEGVLGRAVQAGEELLVVHRLGGPASLLGGGDRTTHNRASHQRHSVTPASHQRHTSVTPASYHVCHLCRCAQTGRRECWCRVSVTTRRW